jgi:hypothetical protein
MNVPEVTSRTALFFRMLASVAWALLPQLAPAHHSGAMYDLSRVVTVRGTVSKYDWRNPHVYIYVEETTGRDERREWKVEALPTTVMQRLAWNAQTLQPGDRIEVKGYPTRDQQSRGLNPTRIVHEQRVLYEQMDSITRLSRAGATTRNEARSLDGTWETLMNLELILSFVTPQHALTPEGAAGVEAFDGRNMTPGADCVPNSAPLLMIDPDVKRITQDKDLIVIEAASGAALRRIHLNVDNDQHAAASVQGHSIGRWEGDTLVIDTRRFSDHRTGNGYLGIPSGLQKHLVERLTLAADGQTLLYRFELEDPQFLAQAVTGEVTWAYRPDFVFSPVECSLDNARRFLE